MARRDSSGSNVSQRDDIRNLPYFHSQFTSTEAVTAFIKRKAKKKSGYFLLRPSNRRRNLLTASVTVPDTSVRHTHIQVDECSSGGREYFLVVEKKFNSIDELVNYYRENPVRNLENVENVYFKVPIMNPDYTANGIVPRTPSMSSLSSVSSMRGGGRYTPNPAETPPPLLPRQRAASSSSLSSSDFSGHPSGGSEGPINRPPLPLPIPAHAHADEEPYMYSQARNVEEDISEKLKDVLKQSERCECGIARIMAELPLGWTVHRSKDALTNGKLFYQSDEGATSWILPQNVKMQLTQKHIANLRHLDPDWGQQSTMQRRRPQNSLSQRGVVNI